MPRRYGYAPKGKPCHGVIDWQARGRVNAFGAMLAGVLLIVGLTTDNVDADLFNMWLTKGLIQNLPPQSVIVMDNASFHKQSQTRQAIENAGHILEYLPPYSPHLNPIEHKWAQAKAIRRKTGKSIDDIFKSKF